MKKYGSRCIQRFAYISQLKSFAYPLKFHSDVFLGTLTEGKLVAWCRTSGKPLHSKLVTPFVPQWSYPFVCSSVHAFVRPSHEVSVNLQTNRLSDWAQIWWVNSLWAWPSLSPCTVINPILLTYSLWAWLTFDHAPLNPHRFLTSDWSSSFRVFADKPLIGFNSNLQIW